MSGGHFNYDQYRIEQITEEIEAIIKGQGDTAEPHCYYQYPEDIIDEFKTAAKLLRRAYVYVQRVDWLVSGDDGEDCFRRRLKEELEELNNDD